MNNRLKRTFVSLIMMVSIIIVTISFRIDREYTAEDTALITLNKKSLDTSGTAVQSIEEQTTNNKQQTSFTVDRRNGTINEENG